ncbi:MAG: hypothetical protein A2390_02460 [Candidatus Liptonbacteria bacterium RIFOXYB1_FULL_36_10]|uniref:SHS2 domain-containing protein n=2 Tax=Candidatus Liptoniibacteriota TaxID=1817909 RepID=A0A1G2CKT9_9BACT|nr:MAG: hypothetical protein A2390_02460 [Candidatus Liptonbacteria bacterium RIFOXYB1_FULL_36_10]OGZ04245.1 MAG: hypothetical protein A2604_02360 [Candidatus Liptonbacteria bacterium RIFOXYD1_FULL_36_11]
MLFHQLKNIFSEKGKEEFVCLEIGESFFKSVSFSVLKGKIFFNSSRLKIFGGNEKNSGEKLELLKKNIEESKIKKGAKTLILGDKSSIYTVLACVSSPRTEFKEEISEGELENLLSQAVWKFMETYKPEAAASLNLPDTEILLANIRILGVKINGHKVLNPLGFRAKSVEFLIEETFIGRDLYHSIESSLLKKSEITFISELGKIEAESILRENNFENSFSLIRIFPSASFLLTSRGAKKNKFYGDISSPVISLSESFSWSKQKLLEKIAVELNLNLETAKDVFARFVENNASRRFLSFIKTILDAEIFSFWQKIFKKTGTEKTILFSSDEILPKSFSVLRQKGKNVSEINIINLAEKFGFSLDFGKKNTKSDNFFFSSLAAFFEYYFSNRDEVLNKLAKRRAKWLIP